MTWCNNQFFSKLRKYFIKFRISNFYDSSFTISDSTPVILTLGYNGLASSLNCHFTRFAGAKYLVFVSSYSVKLKELSFAQFVYFFGKNVFIFQFLNDKIYNYVLFDIIVHFIVISMRELSFAQFVYFLRKVCLFFNF